jgi:hypothetical protein
MGLFPLFAQAAKKGSISLLDPRIAWSIVGLAVVLILGAILIALVDRWRRRPGADTILPSDQLESFRVLYERGEISEDEYNRIRTRLLNEIKGKPKAAPAAPKAPPIVSEAPPPPPDAPTD